VIAQLCHINQPLLPYPSELRKSLGKQHEKGESINKKPSNQKLALYLA